MRKKVKKMAQLLQIRPKEFSVEYTGEIPEDLAVVMVEQAKIEQFERYPQCLGRMQLIERLAHIAS